MLRVRHPYALEDDSPPVDGTVHYGGRRELADVQEDGTFTIPESKRGWLDGWADQYGYDAEELLVHEDWEQPENDEEDVETCSAVKSDGEVCGRDLPCHYHSEEDE